MPPSLPSSLSPHVCILQSPDLRELLEDVSLPPLPQILWAFTPLSQVNTRTTTLTTVPHPTFSLRFSDLEEVEAALHEDDEQRAERTMDWIGSRVAAQSSRWVEMADRQGSSAQAATTPWWDEVKRCVEGEFVPSRHEGWNHPAAIVYAVSTLAANPLQALQDMHARPLDLPPWVDKTHLRYFLIVHPSNSPLSEPIAESLFNAVKKQYGLHSYLLKVSFPNPTPPQPVTAPPLPPRLPPLSSMEMSPMPPPAVPGASPLLTPGSVPPTPRPTSRTGPSEAVKPSGPRLLSLAEGDIQAIARFTREFVVMSLVPWMEKCVLDWNETYSSSRRLPSRLFSSTRRLFGSSAASAPVTPTHGSSPSVSSVTSRFTSHAPSNSVTSLSSITSGGSASEGSVTQQRRLAEFATILGDMKLATSVWDALRKDSKGGSDILPLLLSPSLALSLHASNSIAALQGLASERPALAQLRALSYAVRWDIGIDHQEFLGSVLEGERWLVHASGAAEEPPTALLLGHAAHLSAKKNARRRAALWYLFAADRLEKSGVKPLALHFFRQAHELYRDPPERELSPSFWESEDRSPTAWKGFETILPGIEHEIGRLLYTTGDTEGAVRYFLGLLHDSPPPRQQTAPGLGLVGGDAQADGKVASPDRVYLEDFRVALKHFKTTEYERWEKADFTLPISFCRPKESRARLPGDAMEGDPENWAQLEDQWSSFWRPRGPERLQPGGKAIVDEPFWIDLVVRNPLNVDVTLTNLTVVLQDAKSPESPVSDYVKVETVDDLSFGPRETRTVPISVQCSKPMSLVVAHATFLFLSMLPVKESLAVRGRRLQDTPHQRQNKVYAPDIRIAVQVEDPVCRLQANFVDDRHLQLCHGEWRQMDFWLQNCGPTPIGEVWLVTRPDEEVWVGPAGESSSSSTDIESSQFDNSLSNGQPHAVDLEALHSASQLDTGQSLRLPVLFHASHAGEKDLCVLLVYRDVSGGTFQSTRLTRNYEVRPILQTSVSSIHGNAPEHPYLVNVDVENATSGAIRIKQVVALGHCWTCKPLDHLSSELVQPQQNLRLSLSAAPSDSGVKAADIRQFVVTQLGSVIQGEIVQPAQPPTVELECRHLLKSEHVQSVNQPANHYFIERSRKNATAYSVRSQHPHIPSSSLEHIFPAFNPDSLDFMIYWDFPQQGRSGSILVPGPILGASHAPLRETLEQAENAKAKRSMYAETQRERLEMLEAIRQCEWNAEREAVVVAVRGGERHKHDFSQGPCQIPVTFDLRNYSLTNPVRFTFRLSTGADASAHANLLAPHYTGRLAHRGQLAPAGCTAVTAKLRVNRPGSYALSSWVVDVEVGEISENESSPWRTRQTYQHNARDDPASVTIVDVGDS